MILNIFNKSEITLSSILLLIIAENMSLFRVNSLPLSSQRLTYQYCDTATDNNLLLKRNVNEAN